MQNIIWDDLKFFLGQLKSLSVSKSLTLGQNNFCVSTGCSFESWVCWPDTIITRQDVDRVIKFFAENNISFMWPLYDNNYASILESSGLVYAGDLEAMTLDPDKAITDKVNHDVSFRQVTTPELSREWARTAWSAFNFGDSNVSGNYYTLTEAFMNNKNLSLYTAMLDDKPAGTFLLTHEKHLTGVYYFAVIPELRRKGIAASMMNEICRLSRLTKRTITLQATPIGAHFYRNFGFDDLFAIKIYSDEADIF